MKIWNCTALTGGATRAIDAIPIASLTDEDRAQTTVDNGDDTYDFHVHVFDSSGTSAESSPTIIRPDDYSTAGVWRQGYASVLDGLTVGGSQGNLVTDPNRMIWNVGIAARVGILGVPAGNILSFEPLSSSDSWDIIAVAGTRGSVAVNDTYITLCDITGEGVITNFILPLSGTAVSTVFVKITLDGGTAIELTFNTASVTDRFFAGPVEIQETIYANATVVNHCGWYNLDNVDGQAWRRNNSGTHNTYIAEPGYAIANAPCLYFDTSLKVEMKATVIEGTTVGNYCAVVYSLDQ